MSYYHNSPSRRHRSTSYSSYSYSSSSSSSSSSCSSFSSPFSSSASLFSIPTRTTSTPSFSSFGPAISSATAAKPAFGSASSAKASTTNSTGSPVRRSTVAASVFEEQSRIDSSPILKNASIDVYQAVKEELQTEAEEAKSTRRETGPVTVASENAASNIRLEEVPSGGPPNPVVIKQEKDTRTLKGIPQNPHFGPLQCYSRLAREKLILGWDQIFEGAVDQIQSLPSDNFWVNVDELWKILEELESMGYNVGRLKKQLDKLTHAMTKRKCSESQISDLRIKAEDHRKEKKMIESEISNLQDKADKVQVIVDELMDQIAKVEENLPMVDALFTSLALAPM